MYLYRTLKFLVNIAFKLIYRIEVINRENIPEDGKLIICGNHIHDFDPVLISTIVPRNIFWMGKKELFDIPLLGGLLTRLKVIPVDRDSVELSTIKTSLRILKDDDILGIFPEGTRVKEMNLDNAKPGVALISIKSKAPILPIYIDANYRIFSKIKVYIGEPIEFESRYGIKNTNDDYKEMGQYVLKEIYSLKNKYDGGN